LTRFDDTTLIAILGTGDIEAAARHVLASLDALTKLALITDRRLDLVTRLLALNRENEVRIMATIQDILDKVNAEGEGLAALAARLRNVTPLDAGQQSEIDAIASALDAHLATIASLGTASASPATVDPTPNVAQSAPQADAAPDAPQADAPADAAPVDPSAA
jgi:hypothetical protein